MINDVGTSMSGFASKISAASAKGWTGFQSLWGDQKTTLSSVDTSPGEKSSLLTGKGSPDHKDPSKNRLLSEDDDSWDGWGGEDWKDKNSPDSPGSTPEKKKPTKKEESFDTGNDDELEAWLNDDTPLHSSKVSSKNDGWDSWNEPEKKTKSKKSSQSNQKKSSKVTSNANDGWNDVDWGNNKISSPNKQNEPLVGNLVDLSEDTTTSANENSGWDNEVWADEDDEWQSLDIGSSESSKLK